MTTGIASACSEPQQSAVTSEPESLAAREALALACARAARPGAALAQYDWLLARQPDHVDWLFGQAQALLSLERAAEAAAALEHARSLAPDYEDLWLTEAAALEQLGADDRALALFEAAGQRFPQASWPRQRERALLDRRLLEQGSRLSLGVSHDELSGGRDPWRAVSLSVAHPFTDRLQLFGGLHGEERFDTSDVQAAMGVAQKIGSLWAWNASADIAPDAEVLPEWSLTAELSRALPGARGLSLRARHAGYESVDVDSLGLTLEQYLRGHRLAYTLTGSKPTDIDVQYSHAFFLGRDYGLGSRAGLAAGFGDEAETVAPGVVRVTRNRNLGVAGLHWHTVRWGLAWEAGWYEQGDLYDRVRIRLGLEHRF